MSGGVLSQGFLPQLAFIVIVGLTFCGAIIAVFHRNVLYNVLGLALALSGVAGVYVFLGSLFIGLMQLLIYVGAICIAMVFAIMLSRPVHLPKPKRKLSKVSASVFAGLLILGVNLGIIYKTAWEPAAERKIDWSVKTIGDFLLTKYVLVFEVISLVLLVAMLGAIIISRYNGRISS